MSWRIRFLLLLVGLSTLTSTARAITGLLYLPSKLNPATAKMVVVFHGCMQTSEAMAQGTGWNWIAERENLVIFYPQLKLGTNVGECWNWFEPKDQGRDGELLYLRNEIVELKNHLGMGLAPVFLTGISSGGTMVSGLLACFPKDFEAGAIHSAPLYGSAQNFKDSFKVLKKGPPDVLPPRPCNPKDFKGRVLVFHGSDDDIVHPLHARMHIIDFFGDRLFELRRLDRTNGLGYWVVSYIDDDANVKGQLVYIGDLPHAWSGFNLSQRLPKRIIEDTELPFFYDEGPSATEMMWTFFSGKNL